MKISILALVLLTVSTTVAAWGNQGLGESDLKFAFLIMNQAFLLTDNGKKVFLDSIDFDWKRSSSRSRFASDLYSKRFIPMERHIFHKPVNHIISS